MPNEMAFSHPSLPYLGRFALGSALGSGAYQVVEPGPPFRDRWEFDCADGAAVVVELQLTRGRGELLWALFDDQNTFIQTPVPVPDCRSDYCFGGISLNVSHRNYNTDDVELYWTNYGDIANGFCIAPN
jgi:hypothetical protein